MNTMPTLQIEFTPSVGDVVLIHHCTQGSSFGVLIGDPYDGAWEVLPHDGTRDYQRGDLDDLFLCFASDFVGKVVWPLERLDTALRKVREGAAFASDYVGADRQSPFSAGMHSAFSIALIMLNAVRNDEELPTSRTVPGGGE